MDALFFGNFFIALCASAASAESLIPFDGVTARYLLFIFCATLTLYNGQRVFLADGYDTADHSVRHFWIKEHRGALLGWSFAAAAVGSLLAVGWPYERLALFLACAVLSTCYFIPHFNLRAVPVVKAAFVALLWSFSTSIFPLLLARDAGVDGISDLHIALLAVDRFLLILGLCFVFNIRDIAVDRHNMVQTLATAVGVIKTKRIAIISVLCCASATLFRWYYFPPPHLIQGLGALLCATIITSVVLEAAEEERGEGYYLLWVDGMIILHAALLCYPYL